MPYLVDGHNLIPHLGLRLDSMDDEQDLITRLQEFCRLRRARVEVYFDGAPPGSQQVRKAGAVSAHFIRLGSSADAAIENRLRTLGKQAPNWTVVSSDNRVQSAGRAAHARVLAADDFARAMHSASAQVKTPPQDAALNPEELDEWMSAFKVPKD
jgi:predicted RNA-binding protein with PIN domain